MILGVGTDILEILRMERLQDSSAAAEKIFTEEERRQSEGKVSRLAGDFSVKEAVSKALGTGIRGFSLLDIEVLRDELGKPYVKLYGNAKKIFLRLGGSRLEVSISNTATLVIATAVLFGNSFSFSEGITRDASLALESGEGEKDNVFFEETERNSEANSKRNKTLQWLLPLPERNAESHKGSYGKVEIFASKSGMAGAAIFSALSAYKAGAGLVKVISDKENQIPLQSMVPESIFLDKEKFSLEESLNEGQVLLFGPGIGMGEKEKEFLHELLLRGKTAKDKRQFLILDADALNMISKSSLLEEALRTYAKEAPLILTPHIKEFARLCHLTVEEVLLHRKDLGKKYADSHHCILILKSHDTMVFAPSLDSPEGFLGKRDIEKPSRAGEKKTEDKENKKEEDKERKWFFHNTISCAALSKGGSGDCFAGLLSGLLCILEEKYGNFPAKVLAFQAACLSVLVQVRGAEIAAHQEGQHGVLARELPQYFSLAIEEFIEKEDKENAR